ncbi:MAG: hypothetical protein IJ835_00205 [Muribaculaceae bacterium]|nr:hypothetical protein [Muribaculaceae bacterium]
MKKIMNLLCRMEYNNYLCTAQEKDDGDCYAVGHENGGASSPHHFHPRKGRRLMLFVVLKIKSAGLILGSTIIHQ